MDLTNRLWGKAGRFTPYESALARINDLEREVYNGGFSQYFVNSAGVGARRCVEALKAIGAKESAALLKRACSVFPGGEPPPSRTARSKILEAGGPKVAVFLDGLDDRFFDCRENLPGLAMAYYRANRKGFTV